jgi:hypothetical protein
MDIGSTTISFDGQYSLNGDFSLEATISHLDFSHLSDIFSHFYDKTLSKPDIPLEIGSASIVISKDSGFALELYDLQIGEHLAPEVKVVIGSQGVVFNCTFSDKVTYTFGSHTLDICNATANVTFTPKEQNADGTVQKGSTSVLISGTFQ